MVRQLELKTESLAETVSRLIDENYDLGKLIHIQEILSGYCNKSYSVWISRGGEICRYFLRLYNPQTSKQKILFEHSLLNHIRSNGFTLSASIIPCRNGATVVHTALPEEKRNNKFFLAIFEFLEGEDKYSWTSSNLTDNELVGSAEVLAHFHHCGHGFKKRYKADRVQPRIMSSIHTLKGTFSSFLEHAGDGLCDGIFKDKFDMICRSLNYAASFDGKLEGMKELPIHGDYHPGNLKYCDEKVVGLFDFDWSKIDYRLFDLALGLVYFTSIWDVQAERLRKDKFDLFLATYNEACSGFKHICPLTKQEQSYLVPMLSVANLYILNWELDSFYNIPGLNDEEYFFYIDNTLSLMHWLLLNEDKLEVWVNNS